MGWPLFTDFFNFFETVSDDRGMRNSQSGQAMLEYLLILVITFVVMMGVIYQFNDAFRQWAQGYFGEYLACILETGELPSLGAQGGVQGICDQEFAEFSLASGRPHVGLGTAGAGDGSGAGSGGAGGEGDGGRREYIEAARVRAGPGGDRASEPGGWVSDGRSSRPRTMVAGAEGGKAGRDRYTGSTGFLSAGTGMSDQAGARRRGLRGGQMGWVEERKLPEQGERRPMTPLKREQEENLRPDLIKVERAPAVAKDSEDMEPWTFGVLLRFMLIALIILAILYFLGTQALQIRNSTDAS